MSLGNSYNNNRNQNGPYNPTVYSQYRMNNAESSVDKTCLTFTYWNNFLRISISPRKDTGNDDVQFDIKNGITINLTHSKARMFADILTKFLADPSKFDEEAGVSSGQALLTISNGKKNNSTAPCITIRKIDETGNIQSTYVYQTKADYYFGILNYKEDGTYDTDIESYKGLEIQQMITLLEEYYKAMSGAVAFSVLHEFRWEHHYQKQERRKIADKLGVELGNTNGGGGSYSNKSYFNSGSSNASSASANYEPASIDDIY